jgi:UDP-N-acetylglucosamine 2-epimerase (non-hydrolysing)
VELPIVFPVHPRTKNSIERFNIQFDSNVYLLYPLPYLEFLNLWMDAQVVLTDSGGLQEETSALGIRCITIRKNTERPITVSEGTNILAGTESGNIMNAFNKVFNEKQMKANSIHLWDGFTSKRIVERLKFVNDK